MSTPVVNEYQDIRSKNRTDQNSSASSSLPQQDVRDPSFDPYNWVNCDSTHEDYSKEELAECDVSGSLRDLVVRNYDPDNRRGYDNNEGAGRPRYEPLFSNTGSRSNSSLTRSRRDEFVITATRDSNIGQGVMLSNGSKVRISQDRESNSSNSSNDIVDGPVFRMSRQKEKSERPRTIKHLVVVPEASIFDSDSSLDSNYHWDSGDILPKTQMSNIGNDNGKCTQFFRDLTRKNSFNYKTVPLLPYDCNNDRTVGNNRGIHSTNAEVMKSRESNLRSNFYRDRPRPDSRLTSTNDHRNERTYKSPVAVRSKTKLSHKSKSRIHPEERRNIYKSRSPIAEFKCSPYPNNDPWCPQEYPRDEDRFNHKRYPVIGEREGAQLERHRNRLHDRAGLNVKPRQKRSPQIEIRISDYEDSGVKIPERQVNEAVNSGEHYTLHKVSPKLENMCKTLTNENLADVRPKVVYVDKSSNVIDRNVSIEWVLRKLIKLSKQVYENTSSLKLQSRSHSCNRRQSCECESQLRSCRVSELKEKLVDIVSMMCYDDHSCHRYFSGPNKCGCSNSIHEINFCDRVECNRRLPHNGTPANQTGHCYDQESSDHVEPLPHSPGIPSFSVKKKYGLDENLAKTSRNSNLVQNLSANRFLASSAQRNLNKSVQTSQDCIEKMYIKSSSRREVATQCSLLYRTVGTQIHETVVNKNKVSKISEKFIAAEDSSQILRYARIFPKVSTKADFEPLLPLSCDTESTSVEGSPTVYAPPLETNLNFTLGSWEPKKYNPVENDGPLKNSIRIYRSNEILERKFTNCGLHENKTKSFSENIKRGNRKSIVIDESCNSKVNESYKPFNNSPCLGKKCNKTESLKSVLPLKRKADGGPISSGSPINDS